MRYALLILLIGATTYAATWRPVFPGFRTTRGGTGGGLGVAGSPEPEPGGSNYFVDPETGNHFSDSEGGTFIDPE